MRTALLVACLFVSACSGRQGAVADAGLDVAAEAATDISERRETDGSAVPDGPDGPADVQPRTPCMREEDCGDTTKRACLQNGESGFCVPCGAARYPCCLTVNCNDGLVCVLTPSVPRYCAA